MNESILHGEHYPARVAAVFDSGEEANRAAEHLVRDTDLARQQVRVIDPTEPSIGQKVEPEKRGIWRTLVRSHLALGLVGLTIGLAVAAGLRIAGLPIVASQPMMVTVSLGAFGLLFGLLAGGLVTLRPDHGRVYLMASDAARARDWVVVALATGKAQRKHARDVLSQHSNDVVQSA
jgi:hypothetical protein